MKQNILLDSEKIKSDLIEQIISHFIERGSLPDYQQFRARNHQYIDILDALGREQILRTRDSKYEFPLPAFRKSALWPREKRIADAVLKRLKQLYLEDVKKMRKIEEVMPLDAVGIDQQDLQRALFYLRELNFFAGYNNNKTAEGFSEVRPDEMVLRYSSIEKRLEEEEDRTKQQWMAIQKASNAGSSFLDRLGQATSESSNETINALWSEIQSAYDCNKIQFGSRIQFVKDRHKKAVIFRDVAHAHGCLKHGYYKSAVILAGSIIEELLRLYLKYKGVKPRSDKFSDYIKTCVERKLLKSAIAQLTGAVKDFRNLVHLEKEQSSRWTISKTTANAAVNAIFTVANDFQ